jgi:hypothetical protein
MKNNIKRNHNISEAYLCGFVSNLINFMNRDIIYFNNYGITSTDITSLNNLKIECENYSSDIEELYSKTVYVEEKNDTRISLINAVRDVAKCFIIKYGIDSAEYKSLESAKILNKRDLEVLSISRKAVITATEYLPELLSIGLTQSMIDLITSNADAFESNLHEIDNAVKERNLKAQFRVSKSNELYLLTAKYCKIGKLIWENVNEAKYNDYLLSKAGGPKRSKKKEIVSDNTPVA